MTTKHELLELAMQFHAQAHTQTTTDGYPLRSDNIIAIAEIFGDYLNGPQPQAQPESAASPSAEKQMTPCPECGVVRLAPVPQVSVK